MIFDTPITRLFGIQYPIIQAGMVWCSGWRLASAVSNAGGLGIIGAGSMSPELLDVHIQKCKLATHRPFGINLPLLYSQIDQQIEVLLKNEVKIVFTSAGNPALHTPILKSNGIKVVHVVSSSKFAKKAEDAGCDAIVAEGFEAGGHNGREETTTLCLVPMVANAVNIPVIAAGGIASGRAILAAMALGASAVQIGTLFALSNQSSAHQFFKNYAINSQEGDTVLTLKKLNPVRILKNKFYSQIQQLEQQCADTEQLKIALGKGRSKLGIFEGNLEDGELEIGQVAASIKQILDVDTIMQQLIQEYQLAKSKL